MTRASGAALLHAICVLAAAEGAILDASEAAIDLVLLQRRADVVPTLVGTAELPCIGDLCVPARGPVRLSTSTLQGLRNFATSPVASQSGQVDELDVAPVCRAGHSVHDERILLIPLVPAHHGSTALESVLMSSRNVSTLCSSNGWQCEGRAIMLDEQKSEDTALWYPTLVENYTLGWNFTLALELFSRYWDLDRPILLEKTPRQMLVVEEARAAFRGAQLPARFFHRGIVQLRLAYVMMWRPICLHVLSSLATKHVNSSSGKRVGKLELQYLEKQVEDHRYLTGVGESVLVINLADLMWRGDRTLGRLQGFLPCGGPLDLDFVPRLGVDIFEGNMWKAPLSVRAFGRNTEPRGCCGYDLERRSCGGADNQANLFAVHLGPGLQKQAETAVKYMLHYS